ncbi:MAG: DEAD/DEAH box helicase family protein [Deltaproteobacteria bacterium]
MTRLTVGTDAVLEEASPAVREVLKKKLTMANPRYLAAKKYGRWIGKSLKPTLQFFEDGEQGLVMPRGLAREAIILCRKLMGLTPKIVDRRLSFSELPLSFHGELRPYQQQAVEDLCQHEFGVLEAGTGSGKTVIALAVIARRRQPTIIFVHTKELLYQWQQRIKQFLGVEAGLIGDGSFNVKPISVAIVNSAKRKLDILAPRYGHLLVDECHRVPASLFTEVVTAFASRYTLGLSATAFRSDGLTDLIYYYLGVYRHRVEPTKLYSSGAVLQPLFIQRHTSFHYGYRGNYQRLIKALVNDKSRNNLIVEDIADELKSGSGTILVVSDRVSHCQLLFDMLQTRGIDAILLTGRLPQEERNRVVEVIRRGAADVVVSTLQLIGEGFDCPSLSTLFLTTPIKFSGRILQVVGRILRPAAGKKPKVFDYVDPVRVLHSSAAHRQNLFARHYEEQKDTLL